MERQVVRLGRRGGVAGESVVWELRFRGRIRRVDREWLRQGLVAGWLTGVESVRREDGDWGPLFGRPVYREVFGGDVEPRDHAKDRARHRIARFRRSWQVLAVAAVGFLAGSVLAASPWLLIGAASTAVGAGLVRLRGAMAQHALDTLVDQLVPPVTPPPAPPEDWAFASAMDEVEAYLRGEKSS